MTESTNSLQYSDAAPPQISAFLVLAGDDFDAEACSRAIGLAATELWRQKRSELRDNPHLNNMNWSYGTKHANSFSTNDVVAGVVSEVWPRRDALLEFVELNKLAISLCCNVTIHEERPMYELLPETMRQLADLNAEFRMDIFDYSE